MKMNKECNLIQCNIKKEFTFFQRFFHDEHDSDSSRVRKFLRSLLLFSNFSKIGFRLCTYNMVQYVRKAFTKTIGKQTRVRKTHYFLFFVEI